MPHVVNVSFPGVDSEAAIVALKEVMAISERLRVHVAQLRAKPRTAGDGDLKETTQEALRLSWCHLTPDVDWERVVEILRRIAN